MRHSLTTRAQGPGKPLQWGNGRLAAVNNMEIGHVSYDLSTDVKLIFWSLREGPDHGH